MIKLFVVSFSSFVAIGLVLLVFYLIDTRNSITKTLPHNAIVIDRFYHRPTWKKIIHPKNRKHTLAKTEKAFVLVALDSAGREWNIEVDAKRFYRTHIGDTVRLGR